MQHLIAMSGGVDSSVALLLAKNKFSTAGDTVVGITLALADENSPEHGNDIRNISDAASVCANQSTEHRLLYAYDEFREAVIDYFVNEYLCGRTPNPCVICNRDIKFGFLAEYADRHDFDKLITGHYARLEEHDGYTYLRKAADLSKDQSYMLAFLTQDQLRRAYFPLGELTKTEVRAIAEEHGFVNAHKRDSQDICFIPDGDYVSALRRLTDKIPSGGSYIDKNGILLGKHNGHICYTVGQRKGLGISLGKHAFVLAKDADTNTVILGDEQDLFKKTVHLTDLSFPSCSNLLADGTKCTAKIRYAHRGTTAVFHRLSETTALLEFDESQRAPSPGQFAVMYIDDYVAGAGVISK